MELERIKLLIKNKLYSQSCKELKNLIPIYKDKSMIYFHLAKVLGMMNKHKESIKFSKLCLDISKSERMIFYAKLNMAKAYRNIGDVEKAINAFFPIKNNIYGENVNSDLDDLFYGLINKMQSLNQEYKTKDVIGIYNDYKNFIPQKNLFLYNSFLNEYELANRQTVLESKPRSLHVFLTNKCNVSCIMCPTIDKNNNWVLSKKIMKEISNLFPYLSRMTIQGGEATILPHFKDFLQNMSEYPNLELSLISNFQFRDDELLYLLVKNNVSLTVSADSVYKQEYENIRKMANFDLLLSNLEKLKDIRRKYMLNQKFTLHLNCVIMKNNYDELEKLVDFAYHHNADMITFSPVLPFNHKLSTLSLNKKDSKKLESFSQNAEIKAKQLGIKLNNDMKNLNTSSINYKLKNESYTHLIGSKSDKKIYAGPVKLDHRQLNQAEDLKKRDKIKCFLPWYQMMIEYGSIKPDCKCRKFANLNFNRSLLDIWNGPDMQAYRRLLISGEYKKICNFECFSGVFDKKRYRPVLKVYNRKNEY